MLGTDPKIRVSVAADPIIALAKIKKEVPDVIITDLVMPRMDGLTFLRKIMAERPLPVVVCSEVAHRRTEDAISALELGAVEVIKKPKLGVRDFLHESAVMLVDVVRSAAQAKLAPGPLPLVTPRNTADVVLSLGSPPRITPTRDKIIAIGASTGGPIALQEVLSRIPVNFPYGIMIAIHMPKAFTGPYADRLNAKCSLSIKEAADGDFLRQAEFARLFPNRFFDVGIAEQHAVTFAAGMALEGLIPVVAIYSTFMQRAFDQMLHDICLPNIPVVFALDRAGIVGEDGPTHQGLFDLSFLRPLPNVIIMAPKDERELRDMISSALTYNRPTVIRYPRGAGVGVLSGRYRRARDCVDRHGAFRYRGATTRVGG